MTHQLYSVQAPPEFFLDMGGIERVASVTNSILREHGFARGMFSQFEIHEIRRRERVMTDGIRFEYDHAKSIAANFANIFNQVGIFQEGLQENYLCMMLTHLVGAKLDIVLGNGVAKHHGFSVADHSTERQSDFEVDGVAIHVTTNPSESLIMKAGKNIKSGLTPMIITLGEGVEVAIFHAKNSEWKDRIDVIDATQFLTANIYEHSRFKAADFKATLTAILERYNEIVAGCETDPVLRIRF